MKAYVIKFLQQGVWASLSGGWYYDDNHSTFTNIFHMYSWLFLFLLPLKLYLITDLSIITSSVYCLVDVLFLAFLKFTNFHFHKAFDNGEQIKIKQKEPVSVPGPSAKRTNKSSTLPISSHQVRLSALSDESLNTNRKLLDRTLKRSSSDENKIQDTIDTDEDFSDSQKTERRVKVHARFDEMQSTRKRIRNTIPGPSTSRLSSEEESNASTLGKRQKLNMSADKRKFFKVVKTQVHDPRDLMEDFNDDSSSSTLTNSTVRNFLSQNSLSQDANRESPFSHDKEPEDQKENSTFADKENFSKNENSESKDSEEIFEVKDESDQPSCSKTLEARPRKITNENRNVRILRKYNNERAPWVARHNNDFSSRYSESGRKRPTNAYTTHTANPSDSSGFHHVMSNFVPVPSAGPSFAVDSESSEKLSDNEKNDKKVDENFRECLNNFKQINTHVHNTGASKLGRSHTHRVAMPTRQYQYTNSGRLRRTASDVRPRHLATPPSPRRPARRRHPAGDVGRKEEVEVEEEERLLVSMRRDDVTVEVEDVTTSDEDASMLDLCSTNQKPQTHIAKDHHDTSEGAVHTFTDENGRVMTYTFGNESTQTARRLTNRSSAFHQLASQRREEESPLNVAALMANTQASRNSRLSRIRRRRTSDGRRSFGTGDAPSTNNNDSRLRMPDQQELLDAIRRSLDWRNANTDNTPSEVNSQVLSNLIKFDFPKRAQSQASDKFLYKLKIFPWLKEITVKYDRLALLDLLDKNASKWESLMCLLLMALVCLLGVLLLRSDLVYDLSALWLCAVIASSQFSLICSVQPDSASPTHGHNQVIAYSRPVYFILSASLLLLFNYLSQPSNVQLNGVVLYNVLLFTNSTFLFATTFMLYFVLFLPLIFLFGLLPQVTTFATWLLEQIDIHLFGGSGSTSLLSSAYVVSRNILTAIILTIFCYFAMTFKEGSEHILFSAFVGFLFFFCYHISRQTSSPFFTWQVIKNYINKDVDEKNKSDKKEQETSKKEEDYVKEADDVSKNYVIKALKQRLEQDIIFCPVIIVLVFAIHCSSVFTVFNPYLSYVLYLLCVVVGFVQHYVIPQLRNNYPWLLCNKPIFMSHEHTMFEVKEKAVVMWFEKFQVFLSFIERNLILPLVVISQITMDASHVTRLYGNLFGSMFLVMISMKLVRSSYTQQNVQYQIVTYAVLFTWYDGRSFDVPICVNLFFGGIIFSKTQDLLLKLRFWQVYVAPWQISWGSAFHAFAQPFVAPHSVLLSLNCLLSTLLHTPFSPLLGSAIFLSSYPRPNKFWEKDYNTRRKDHSNTRLSSQLDRATHSDDNNLNSVFYEHLTNSLQKSLAGDIAMGRWGTCHAGDCFILTSDHLNAMVHIVEICNGVVTFQLRGLEFSGTYCQQREVEAINERTLEQNRHCMCCKLPAMKHLLSFNAAFHQRWMAWQVLARNYVLDGYSISDNNASTMLGVYDLRKVLVGFIVKCCIYFLCKHPSLDEWLSNEHIMKSIRQRSQERRWADNDACFSAAIDDDFDVWLCGVTLQSFNKVYLQWVKHCYQRREKSRDEGGGGEPATDSKLPLLAFALTAFARRALSSASLTLAPNLDAFLFGLHSVFKGDIRVQSHKDEWVMCDVNLMKNVVQPAVRTALKLHQDHFTYPDEFEEDASLYDSIAEICEEMVITHEGDPLWRRSVLGNAPNLLALRRQVSEAFVDQYSVVKLQYKSLGFTLVRVNRECVRGLWAGQQSELVFLRNRNPERGSIQNAKQVLRNMINSSCDQPIGYPIYVSPLTTSYATSNEDYNKIIFKPLTVKIFRNWFTSMARCIRESCTGGCNSGGGYHGNPSPGNQQPSVINIPMATLVHRTPSIAVSNLSSLTRDHQKQTSGRFTTSVVNQSSDSRQISDKKPPISILKPGVSDKSIGSSVHSDEKTSPQKCTFGTTSKL